MKFLTVIFVLITQASLASTLTATCMVIDPRDATFTGGRMDFYTSVDPSNTRCSGMRCGERKIDSVRVFGIPQLNGWRFTSGYQFGVGAFDNSVLSFHAINAETLGEATDSWQFGIEEFAPQVTSGNWYTSDIARSSIFMINLENALGINSRTYIDDCQVQRPRTQRNASILGVNQELICFNVNARSRNFIRNYENTRRGIQQGHELFIFHNLEE